MAHRALPLLYVNMGGEMLYILSQRLKAQRIDADKAHRGTLAGLLLRAPCLSAWPHALHDAVRFQRSTRKSTPQPVPGRTLLAPLALSSR